jgi:hypothetical protein
LETLKCTKYNFFFFWQRKITILKLGTLNYLFTHQQRAPKGGALNNLTLEILGDQKQKFLAPDHVSPLVLQYIFCCTVAKIH